MDQPLKKQHMKLPPHKLATIINDAEVLKSQLLYLIKTYGELPNISKEIAKLSELVDDIKSLSNNQKYNKSK